MARTVKKTDRAKFVGYAPYKLDKAIKATVKKSIPALDDCMILVVQHVEDGCKVSIEYEPERDCYHVQAFQRTAGHANAGLILSARHSDLATAFRILQAVDHDVFAGEWANPQNEADQYSW